MKIVEKEWMIMNGKAGWTRGCIHRSLEGCLIEGLNSASYGILANSINLYFAF